MPFKCRDCQKTFRTENGRNWHRENIHRQVKTFELDDASGNDIGQVAEMMVESIPLPATQNELVELIEGVVIEQVNDGSSPTSALLSEREMDLLLRVKSMVVAMIGDSDQFLRTHIEHRLDDRLQAITPIHQEATKVKNDRDPLAPWLRQRDLAKTEDGSDPLTPYRRKWPTATPAKVAKMNADPKCPLRASGKRCDHLQPRREHAALRAIGFPETFIREQARPAKVAEMEGYFPGPLTGCLSHLQHERSHDLESSPSMALPVSKEVTESVDNMIIREVLKDMGYAV